MLPSYDEAFDCKEEADSLASALLLGTGSENPHIFHIYCRGVYNYIKRWVPERKEKKQMLQELLNTVKTGIELHPFNRRLDTIFQAVNRAYINQGLSRDDIEDPEIPAF